MIKQRCYAHFGREVVVRKDERSANGDVRVHCRFHERLAHSCGTAKATTNSA